MIPPTYKPKKKFMQLAIAEAKRARDRGDYAIGAVITQLHWKSGSGYRIGRQPGKNFGFVHQARGA
jgi:tRNA(Arg) A34 adenosine deaminase TadA